MKNENLITMDGLFRIPMQYFAEGDDAGNGSDGGDAGQGNNPDGNANNNNDNNSSVDLEKLLQSRLDKAMAEERKKSAALQKELDKVKKDKMTDDERKQAEISEKEKELAEREQMLLDKENRLTAIKAIKEAGLDDGSGLSLELVDFVMGDNEEAIKNKVKTFKELFDKFVKAEVDKTFKQNGRNPNGSNNPAPEGNNNDNSVAAKLGAAEAAKAKQSTDILNLYLGGKN